MMPVEMNLSDRRSAGTVYPPKTAGKVMPSDEAGLSFPLGVIYCLQKLREKLRNQTETINIVDAESKPSRDQIRPT
jgi:hypothetical protein